MCVAEPCACLPTRSSCHEDGRGSQAHTARGKASETRQPPETIAERTTRCQRERKKEIAIATHQDHPEERPQRVLRRALSSAKARQMLCSCRRAERLDKKSSMARTKHKQCTDRSSGKWVPALRQLPVDRTGTKHSAT